MNGEITRYGFTEYEKNYFKVQKRKSYENIAWISISLLIFLAFIVATIYISIAPPHTYADTAPSSLDTYCIKARMDAIQLRSEGIQSDYGENLINLCGSLN